MLSFPLYASCLFSIPSTVHIVDIEYPLRICSPTFIVDTFSGLFLLSSTSIFTSSKIQDLYKK